MFRAILENRPESEIEEIVNFYDYLEIQPVGNNEFMVRASTEPDKVDKKTGAVIKNRLRHVKSLEVIRDFNRKVVELADGKVLMSIRNRHKGELVYAARQIEIREVGHRGYGDTKDIDKVTLKVSYKNPKTIITTSGADAKLFRYQNNYFVHTIIYLIKPFNLWITKR